MTPRDKITICNDEGEEVTLPSKWEICDVCSGEGKHSLAVDGHGITSEEWEMEWDEEMREDYFAGRYDKTCSDCEGTGKVKVVDESRLSPEIKKLWFEWQKDEAEYRALCEMERRMGA